MSKTLRPLKEQNYYLVSFTKNNRSMYLTRHEGTAFTWRNNVQINHDIQQHPLRVIAIQKSSLGADVIFVTSSACAKLPVLW